MLRKNIEIYKGVQMDDQYKVRMGVVKPGSDRLFEATFTLPAEMVELFLCGDDDAFQTICDRLGIEFKYLLKFHP